jgi:hypothetical protein
MQAWEASVNRLPDNFKVHLEVAVCQGIAHLVRESQWQLGVLCGERGVVLFAASACWSSTSLVRTAGCALVVEAMLPTSSVRR